MPVIPLYTLDLVDLPLVFVRSPSAPDVLDINQGELVESPLLPLFDPGFRLFDGADLNKLVDAANNANIALALLARQRVLTAPGNYSINMYDFNVLVNKTASQATTLTLPAAIDRINGGYTFGPLIIKDLKQDAGTYAITVNAATVDADGNPVTDTIDGLASWTIGGNGASLGLRPLADGTGWFVA